MGKPGYFGPCPPVGRVHNYVFTLHALNTEKLNPPTDAIFFGYFLVSIVFFG
jgi:phosphatidylethanolamine-binding protein (PEBP) family uncharacterized protein